MPTRRQALAGLALAGFGSGALSAGAFTSSVAAAADLRVAVVEEDVAGVLTLTPGREDASRVETDDDGEVVRIVLENVNRSARSRFEEVVEITNNSEAPITELNFAFEFPEADQEEIEDLESAVGILVEGDRIEGGETVLGEGETLSGGDSLLFGVVVDLDGIGDFPDSELDAELRITATGEDG